MPEKLKRRLPAVAAVSILVALTSFFFINQKIHRPSMASDESRRVMEAALAELQALQPGSFADPSFRPAVDNLCRNRHIVEVWIIQRDGRVAFSTIKQAEGGMVDEWATDEARRILSEMPEGFLSKLQEAALLAASTVQREGDHNDVFRQLVRPLHDRDGVELGIVAVSYDPSPEPGKFPGLGYAVPLFLIPIGLAVYWLALAAWTFLDAGSRGERAWVWAAFVLLGNLVALLAYVLARRPRSASGRESPKDSQ